MDSQILNVDVSILKFKGLSSRTQRLIALVSTLLILVAVGIALMQLASTLEKKHIADQTGLVLSTILLVHFILTGKVMFSRLSRWLVRRTPLGVLHSNDKRVLEAAKTQLTDLAERVRFSDYENYKRINPYISVKECMDITSLQSCGDLMDWLGDVKNLKIMSNLVYQLWAVEQAIANGIYARP